MQTHATLELIRRCATKRDPELWEEFVDRFGCRLWAGVQRALLRYDARLGEDEREDLLQEVYCRLLEKRGRSLRRCRGEADGAVRAYLGRVAESVAIDYLRGLSAAKRGRSMLLDVSPWSACELANRAVDPGRTPLERLLLVERRSRFLGQCRDLMGDRNGKRNLQVVYLAFFEGWTSREICARLGQGLTPSTVDSLVHRLKKRLSRHGVVIPRRRPGAVKSPRGLPPEGGKPMRSKPGRVR